MAAGAGGVAPGLEQDVSATGRGKRGGGGADFFPTPRSVVERIIARLDLPAGGHWLEPSAGDGAIIRAAQPRAAAIWTAVELREECRARLTATVGHVIIGDFLSITLGRSFDVAILNPPFVQALRFVDRCLAIAGTVIALLRLNWLETQEREPFLRRHTPDVYVLPDRPSFTGDGATDATAYAWFVWPAGHHDRSSGRIEVLPYCEGQAALAIGDRQ